MLSFNLNELKMRSNEEVSKRYNFMIWYVLGGKSGFAAAAPKGKGKGKITGKFH